MSGPPPPSGYYPAYPPADGGAGGYHQGGQQYPPHQLAQQQQYPPQYQQQQVVKPQSGSSNGVIRQTTGSFNGVNYSIDHRDCNTIVTVNLPHNVQLFAKPGSMVAMSPTVSLKGKVKFSFTRGFKGESTYSGPGEILLAPPAYGDIIAIPLDGRQSWSVARDGYLAYTEGVTKETKTQGLGKALFSGEGFFVWRISGHGFFFATSVGAIIEKNLAAGEQYIVDNDHLVAWNCNYSIERVASGGFISNSAAGEGLVCKFTGPGKVYLQTRNPQALGEWIASHM